ncbi:hypothetical protein CUMW_065670 [Citrus unshiu]|nr:hypothetical protein CUMW_065670 [Citrus unshiu]
MMCGSELILTQMGVPVPNPKRMSKVLFTTRFVEVCGHKEAHEMFRMECLRHEEAWKLFQMKVGKETMDDHSDIPKLVEIVTKECGGLPLVLVTTARAMAYKKTIFGLARGILTQMIHTSGAHNEGYYNIGVLRTEEDGEGSVTLHDVIRDMALWIAYELAEEEENFWFMQLHNCMRDLKLFGGASRPNSEHTREGLTISRDSRDSREFYHVPRILDIYMCWKYMEYSIIFTSSFVLELSRSFRNWAKLALLSLSWALGGQIGLATWAVRNSVMKRVAIDEEVKQKETAEPSASC